MKIALNWNDLKVYEQENKMTYITSMEKIGFQRGLQEGKQEGRQETQQEIVMSMLAKNMPLEAIARLTKLSIEQIKSQQEKDS